MSNWDEVKQELFRNNWKLKLYYYGDVFHHAQMFWRKAKRRVATWLK